MAEPAAPVAGPATATDPGALMNALRARRAERFDPVRFRLIEALARRAATQGTAARRVLDRRLSQLLADYGERFARAETEARDALARATARFPEAAAALREHWDAGDFGGLHRRLARLEAHGGSGPLAALLARTARHAPDGAAGPRAPLAAVAAEQRGELKSLRYFRSTWARLAVERQLSRALAQAPENAGPLNSHLLVLQSLRLMRDISPEYLAQFMSYVDALLWLDQADASRGPAQKNAAGGERGARRKSRRGTAG